ncbi:uncharacterized protein LOC116171055 isoform X2 [Photinus pyralis]|uniref:uncharacterized protein LOC116171055 isoform X2 n=1 Tax=Photinus pyralis TaxID=7054 RepID=UPI0012671381|nr:uncharacterized protein LOC116171055 isoform X2 [Photinus pyralis]
MTRRTCRTCLKSVNGNECVRLQSSIQALEIEAELRFCMPEINFNLIDEAYMCCRCVDSLHQSYLFKNECLRSEERIRNFVKANQDKDISLEELSVNNNLEAGSNVDVIDELNSVLDEVLKQNLPCTSNLVLSNVVDDVSDSMYTFSQSIVQSRTNLTKKSCVVYLAKVTDATCVTLWAIAKIT